METQDEVMRRYFAAISVPTRAAEPIVLWGLLPEARTYLERHGCVIVEGDGVATVSYPAGAISTELLPRTCYERFKIVLPDGTQLQEARTQRTHRLASGNCLYLLEHPV